MKKVQRFGMTLLMKVSNAKRLSSRCSRRLSRLFNRPLCNPLTFIFEKQNINQLSSFVLRKAKQSMRLRSAQFGAAEFPPFGVKA